MTAPDRPVRILHVEDEDLNRSLVRAVLVRAPDARLRAAEIDEAPNLAEARRLLARDPDLVLLDVRLPDGNGLDLVREIRVRGPRPSVVVMSASVLPAQREEALGAGCDAFVAKPYTPAALVATLRELLFAADRPG